VCYKKEKKCFFRTGDDCTTDSQCQRNNYGSLKAVCDVTGSKKCLLMDPDRAGSHCDEDDDCSYGVCGNMTVKNVINANGTISVQNEGVCSGGCACDIEYVQRSKATNPLKFVCEKRCDVTPCTGNTREPCYVDRVTGKQVCKCKQCYSGEKCENGSLSTTKDKYIFHKVLDGEKRINVQAWGYVGVVTAVNADGTYNINCTKLANCVGDGCAGTCAEASATKVPPLQVFGVDGTTTGLTVGSVVTYYPHDIGVVEPGDYGAKCAPPSP
jgi:hypothetical protein